MAECSDLTPFDTQPKAIAIFANPKAGSRSRLKLVNELAGALRERRFDTLICWERQELENVGQLYEAGVLRCIVAVGGDGTLAEVINRAPGIPVALLPTGTENVLARHLRMPTCARTVADLVADGHT